MDFNHVVRFASPAHAAIISALALAACGGSGGGGGGGSALSVTDKAAAAGFSGVYFALDSSELAGQAGEQNDPQAASFSRAAAKAMQQMRVEAKNTQACSSGGSITETASTAESLFAGSIATQRVVADNCEEVIPEAQFSLSQNGIVEVGEVEGGAVLYLRTSGPSDDPDGSDTYSSRSSSPDFVSEIDMRGLVEVCDGCSAPQSGGTIEQVIYLQARFLFDGQAFELNVGEGSASPLQLVGTLSGSTFTADLNGLLGVDVTGTPCAFSADYETVEDLVFENFNGQEERITGGEMNITVDGGAPLAVVFQADGSLTVDGQTYTEADLKAFDQQCGFEA